MRMIGIFPRQACKTAGEEAGRRKQASYIFATLRCVSLS